MRGFLPTNRLLVAAVLLLPILSHAQETGEIFRLEGMQRFASEAPSTWTVYRDSVDEESRSPLPAERFAVTNSDSAVFIFRKLEGKETSYRVANGSGGREYVVRVFEPDKIASFTHKSKGNPDVRTYIFVPATLSPETRLVVVMHGLSRNADGYIASWEEWAKKNDYVVIAPEFRRGDWRSPEQYNSGNVIFGGKLQPRSRWSFQVVEDIAERVRAGFRLSRTTYDMFGHSAGGQFVHRFALFMPDARVRLFLAANAGWYTAPDLSVDFPYGLKHPLLGITDKDVMAWTEKNLVLFRGTDDTERTSDLRQTPEADAQGQNRYERAGFMFERISAVNPGTNWTMIEVPGAVHSQREMAPSAQKVLEDANREESLNARN